MMATVEKEKKEKKIWARMSFEEWQAIKLYLVRRDATFTMLVRKIAEAVRAGVDVISCLDWAIKQRKTKETDKKAPQGGA